MLKFASSKVLMIIVVIIAALVVLVLVFNIGLTIGSRKAAFFCRWNENYEHNLTAPAPFPDSNPNGNHFMDADGVAGKILKVNGGSIVIEDNAGTDRVVLLSTTTEIRSGTDMITLSELTPNETVVVIGSPDIMGQIEAHFIRVLASPQQ